MSDERTPLLQGQNSDDSHDPHAQFCELVGIPPSNEAPGAKHASRPTSLYTRATRERHSQSITYMVTATLSNSLLLTQVILGATLTALGASESSHVLITVFGVLNTIIAGLVAYLKSRGQPMRARMFRDDLERVVDEIENSEVMWLGISKSMSGYNEIDTTSQVTVRSEVARLTRLYDRAVKTNTANNPDIYSTSGGSNGFQAASLKQPSSSQVPLPVGSSLPPTATSAAGAVAVPSTLPDPDDSPAATVSVPQPLGSTTSDHAETSPNSDGLK